MSTLIPISFFSILWWAFTDGSAYQLWLGAAFVALATAATMASPKRFHFPHRTRINALAKFVPYFIYQSLKGGFLVARLALLPQRLIRSQYFQYDTRIPRESVLARMWFASSLCIFPGTLSCGYKEDVLVIHALDTGLFDIDSVLELEKMIAAIFSAEGEGDRG